MRVTGIRWQSGNSPSFVTLSNLPTVGNTISQPQTVNFRFDASTAGYFADTLIIDLECVEGKGCNTPPKPTQTLMIPFVGRIDCMTTSEDCKPTGPSCRVDFNSELSVWFPTTNFFDGVKDAIGDATAKHYAGNRDYDLPVSTIWKLAGLSDLFDDPGASGCACSGSGLPDIHLTHSANSELLANFLWQSPTGAPITIKSKANPLSDVVLQLPAEMRGTAIFGASYVEFWYGSVASSPKITSVYNGPPGDWPSGSTIFDDNVMCTGTSLQYATVKPANPGADIPNLPLYAADDSPTP